MKQFPALHQSPELELKHLKFFLCSECDPQNFCSKWPSRRARKSLTNGSSMFLEEQYILNLMFGLYPTLLLG